MSEQPLPRPPAVDHPLGAHTETLGRYAAQVARKMGCSPFEADEIAQQIVYKFLSKYQQLLDDLLPRTCDLDKQNTQEDLNHILLRAGRGETSIKELKSYTARSVRNYIYDSARNSAARKRAEQTLTMLADTGPDVGEQAQANVLISRLTKRIQSECVGNTKLLERLLSILRLFAEGYCQRDIAAKLNLSNATICNHVALLRRYIDTDT